ncbi:OmpA family protein [uncultured Roseobacter sp.]|uniref:OmpA family protein n=1 Tax=uncultured Roseobacter sp. TaxID=114847 RepID=UPI0026140604|nr:OmpA family protein [uncultured Roseobacter sp.]
MVAGGGAGAQTASQEGLDKGQYVPSIWVDPDGCEHWVMDDGVEGFMTPHVTRDGIPVCREANLCAVMTSDQFFAVDSARLGSGGRARLSEFFAGSRASAFVITGHTDSTASDAYNMQLSVARARAVAQIARGQGAIVSDVRGFGERQPVATNDTSAGRAQNRRVEITCIE